MGFTGHWEILVIVLVILLLFGGRKIPELARGMGRGIREFRDGMKGGDKDKDEAETSTRNKDEKS